MKFPDCNLLSGCKDLLIIIKSQGTKKFSIKRWESFDHWQLERDKTEGN